THEISSVIRVAAITPPHRPRAAQSAITTCKSFLFHPNSPPTAHYPSKQHNFLLLTSHHPDPNSQSDPSHPRFSTPLFTPWRGSSRVWPKRRSTSWTAATAGGSGTKTATRRRGGTAPRGTPRKGRRMRRAASSGTARRGPRCAPAVRSIASEAEA
uniref:Uncharacterized protein n=1 Tax=Aegilops tauschii subsp. strangulata TaxID=200361 RepID=A0A453CJT4_AEGTS